MRSRRAPYISITLLMSAGLGFGLTACTSSPVDAEESASTAACESLQELSTNVQTLQDALGSEMNVGELRDLRETVKDSYESVTAALSDVEAARMKQLTDAWKELDTAIGDLDENASLPDAAASLTEETRLVAESARHLNSELTCNTASN